MALIFLRKLTTISLSAQGEKLSRALPWTFILSIFISECVGAIHVSANIFLQTAKSIIENKNKLKRISIKLIES